MRRRVVPIIFVITAILGFSIALFAEGQEGYMKSDGLYLPLGNPGKGREAFIALKCFSCHQVHTDLSLPQPVTIKRAPVLARPGMVHNPGDFADAILSPQHKVVVDSGGETEAGRSRMGDFSETMTVRQFVDIVAYLMEQEGW